MNPDGSTRRICVWGTSLRKVADEAQVIAFLRSVARRFPDARLTLFSRYGDEMRRAMARDGIEVESFPTSDLRRVKAALDDCDVFVIEGGPFYEELRQACICLLLAHLARRSGTPVVAYAATAFRFRTIWGKAIYRRVFRMMDAITVRERIGAEIIEELGTGRRIELFADPRVALDPPPAEATRRLLAAKGVDPDAPYVCVTTRFLHPRLPRWVKRSHAYSPERVARANAVIGEALTALAKRAQIVILPMHPTIEEDRAIAAAVAARMADGVRVHSLGRRYDALDLIGLIGRAEMLFACRVGSAIFATTTATPTLAIAFEPRMSDHMDRMGFGDFVFDWRELDPARVKSALDDLWERRAEIRRRMRDAAGAQRELAQKNVEILAPYL